MDKKDLIELLEQVAKEDLVEGKDIFDHPCTVAVRAINQCFEDIEYLQDVATGHKNAKCKKAVLLVQTKYNPEW